MSVKGRFADRDCPPADADLRAALGDASELWDRLVAWMAETYGLAGEWVWTTADWGWALRYRRSGRSLLTLAPRAEGGFQALVVVGPSVWDEVSEIDLGSVLRAAWDAAKPYPDGRWLFVPVTAASTVDGIERLIALKSPPPRTLRRRIPTAV